ncbi:PREDICTED: sperm-associated antigen 17-like [Cyprinodon variegatus]|uniref:sperm-associated antigen 17-like n=1 Tax=Cyprinodon variegatus TaxID=28743 RepID=UPI0007428339|nr:PREDICTED: sperm-associated antigen 17-like [Cyprinodon variegatus]
MCFRQEISEEKAYREALRKKTIVPYLHPENLSIYQGLLRSQIPAMRSPSQSRAEAILKDAPQESTPRSLNPTPLQSESQAAERETPERRHTSPISQSADPGESSLMSSSAQCKSAHLDVMGKPRRTKVRLPGYLLSSKPPSVPNQHFLAVEKPIRRMCRTASLANPSNALWGFQLLPSSVDFGTKQKNTCSTITVLMRNVGFDVSRFYVKQPHPTTGLRVLYNRGPVAAGLQVELEVQLFAICDETEQKKDISQDIAIHTEAEILYLPVTATILPERFRKGGSHSRQADHMDEPPAL